MSFLIQSNRISEIEKGERFHSIMLRNTMKPSFPRYSLILCKQKLPAGSEMVDIVESVFSQIKLSAAAAETGMVQRYGILMTNIEGLSTAATGSIRKGRSLVNHHIMMSGN